MNITRRDFVEYTKQLLALTEQELQHAPVVEKIVQDQLSCMRVFDARLDELISSRRRAYHVATQEIMQHLTAKFTD